MINVWLLVSTMTVTLTSYRSVPNQTDDSPFITSIGHRVSEEGTAVSQDLIASKQVCYGDIVVIPKVGFRVVNDTMNKRHTKHVDIWVSTLEEERRIGLRKDVPVFIIKSPTRYCGGAK